MSSGRLPDFIIGGAMKSATSSLHHILSHHEDVYIPKGEIHFFCMDDIIQHPEFISSRIDDARIPDYEKDFEENLEWYKSFFEPAGDDQWIGEDSTIYLASEEAPSRMKSLLPDVKLIFMLRNPVERTYSHYWHLVKSGRAVFRFEHELQRGSSTLHLRSFYKPQIDRYLSHFSRDQIKIILFERFIEETQEVVDEVCSFLNLPTSVNLNAVKEHQNKSPTPRLYRTQLLMNYLFQGIENRYEDHLPHSEQGFVSWFIQGVIHHLRQLNLGTDSPPPMKKSLRARLTKLYARKNQGLKDLLEVSLEDYWSFVKTSRD